MLNQYAKTFILFLLAFFALLTVVYFFIGGSLVGTTRRILLIVSAFFVCSLVHYLVKRKALFNAFEYVTFLAIVALTTNSIVNNYNQSLLRRYSFEPRFTILAVKDQAKKSSLKLVIKQENPGIKPFIKQISVNPSFIYEDPATKLPDRKERVLKLPKEFRGDDLVQRDEFTFEIANLEEVLCAEVEVAKYCQQLEEGNASFEGLHVKLVYSLASRHPPPKAKGDGSYVIPEHHISINQ